MRKVGIMSMAGQLKTGNLQVDRWNSSPVLVIGEKTKQNSIQSCSFYRVFFWIRLINATIPNKIKPQSVTEQISDFYQTNLNIKKSRT